MANRRYDQRKERKLKEDYGSRPSPGLGSGSTKKFEKERSIPYSGAPGPKGHGFKQGQGKFSDVKTAVKKDY